MLFLFQSVTTGRLARYSSPWWSQIRLTQDEEKQGNEEMANLSTFTDDRPEQPLLPLHVQCQLPPNADPHHAMGN